VNHRKLMQQMVYLALAAMPVAACNGGQVEPIATPASIPPTPTSLPALDLPKLAELKSDQGPAYSLAWSPDGSRLAAGSGVYDKATPPGKVIVWAVPSPED
jgi:hypothetical protein